MTPFQMSALALAAIVAGTGASFGQSRDLSVQQQMVAAVSAPESDLHVTAWVDRENLMYEVGEPIQLSVKVDADAYLTIIGFGPSGDAVQLYPNQFQPGRLVEAGETIEIPGADAPAQIIASAPAGVELVRVIATTSKDAVIPVELLGGSGAFRSIEGGAEQVARELAVVATTHSTLDFYDKVIFTIEASGSIESEANEPVAEEASVERQPPLIAVGDEYKVGDTVELAVTAMEDCILWVVNVSPDKTAHVLFPKDPEMDNTLAVGETVVVSGANSPIKVVAMGPAGTEAIYALCSEDETPPWLAGLDFTQLFPNLDASEGLGKALVAMDVAAAVEPAQPTIPDVYSWQLKTISVVD